jgi:hypothetical protein
MLLLYTKTIGTTKNTVISELYMQNRRIAGIGKKAQVLC